MFSEADTTMGDLPPGVALAAHVQASEVASQIAPQKSEDGALAKYLHKESDLYVDKRTKKRPRRQKTTPVPAPVVAQSKDDGGGSSPTKGVQRV